MYREVSWIKKKMVVSGKTGKVTCIEEINDF